jgi:hypothetical protein
MGFVTFPEGASNKKFQRYVAYSICGGRGVLFNADSMQTIFLKIDPTLLAGRSLGSVRSFFGNLFWLGR